jgi:hypothetical protein
MDASTTKFGSATEFATLTSDRGTIGSGVFDRTRPSICAREA